MVLYFIWSYCTVSHCYVLLLQRAGELPRSASSHFDWDDNDDDDRDDDNFLKNCDWDVDGNEHIYQYDDIQYDHEY